MYSQAYVRISPNKSERSRPWDTEKVSREADGPEETRVRRV